MDALCLFACRLRAPSAAAHPLALVFQCALFAVGAVVGSPNDYIVCAAAS